MIAKSINDIVAYRITYTANVKQKIKRNISKQKINLSALYAFDN